MAAVGRSDGAEAVGGQWDGVLQVTVEIGVVVCVLMLLLQVIASALRQDFAGLGRGVRGVMIAMIGTFASFVITDSLLSVVDSMSAGVMQSLAGTTTWTDLGAKVIHAETLTSGALGSAAMLLCAMIMLLSSLVVWLALMVRKMLLIIGAAFAPIAFGGAPFDVTSAWVRRWIEYTVAMVFSKLVLVMLFGIGLQIELGLGQVGTGTGQEITQMMTGLLVMSVAGFAPWLALQFVHWAGGNMQWQLRQHAESAHAGGQAAIAAPQRLYAGAQRGFGAVTTAGGAIASGVASQARGASGNGSSGADGSGGPTGPTGGGGGASGGSNGDGGSDGGGGGGSAGGGGGGASGAAESAYESGRSQTAQALALSGGPSGGGGGGGSQSGNSGSGGQGGGGTGSSQGAGGGGSSGQAFGSGGSVGSGSDGAGGGTPAPAGGSGGGSGAGPSGPPDIAGRWRWRRRSRRFAGRGADRAWRCGRWRGR